jgi:type III secretion protein D
MELRILSGLHRGAAMEIEAPGEGEGMTIGASPGGDMDVLLADAGIARRHCRLQAHANRWHLEPLQGKVFDAQGRELTAATPVERGQSFRVGDVWIGFFDEADPWQEPPAAVPPPSAPARYPRLNAPVAAAVALCALGIPAAWFATTAWGKVQQLAAQEESAAQAAVEVPEVPVSPAKLAEEFTRALAERELKERLDLQLDAQQWEIRGSLDADERQRFERLLVRFTESRKPAFPIKVSLVSPAELLPFKVVEVISGKGASIVTDAGERVHVGDVHQGWKLLSVDAGKVAFQGRQRVEVVL